MSYFRVPTIIFSKVCFNSFTMRYCTPLSSAEGARHVLGRARPNISKTYGNCFFSILNIHIGPKTWHSYKNALLKTWTDLAGTSHIRPFRRPHPIQQASGAEQGELRGGQTEPVRRRGKEGRQAKGEEERRRAS